MFQNNYVSIIKRSRKASAKELDQLTIARNSSQYEFRSSGKFSPAKREHLKEKSIE